MSPAGLSPVSWLFRIKTVAQLLDQVMGEFEDRHENAERIFRNRFAEVRHYLDEELEPSVERQALIGSHFTHEYSPESAALFNPSIVLHPDQTGLAKGAVRFILSLRATGEGHISSITFRVGVVSARSRITLMPPVPFVTEPERVSDATYDKPQFARKLKEGDVQERLLSARVGSTPRGFRPGRPASHSDSGAPENGFGRCHD